MLKKILNPKNLPNFITLIRAKTAFLFLLVSPFSPLFYLLYVICGLTDMADGILARKLNAVSSLGQCLDSLADLLFFFIVGMRVLPLMHLELWLLIWISLILLVKIVSLCIGFVKFHEFSFLHTYENKLTGLLLFFYPAMIGWLGVITSTIIVSAAATVTAIEEQIILLRLKTLHRDVKGIFEVKRT